MYFISMAFVAKEYLEFLKSSVDSLSQLGLLTHHCYFSSKMETALLHTLLKIVKRVAFRLRSLIVPRGGCHSTTTAF